jgi:hypothetical protein
MPQPAWRVQAQPREARRHHYNVMRGRRQPRGALHLAPQLRRWRQDLCVHETDAPDTIREHARRGGFPADLVVEITSDFGPDATHSRSGSTG